ncbi:hypothetical protein GCM10011521_16900 [Arenimonas soli]|uniref:CAAX prenyl protease 2/Lysostaphin resistance protein A-like domain-containing protein n=1 Tax=Arenimonas soli TaxID=2269504 RepID=A0ABQ1HJE6_9GAMM|nr:CPBP family intramembrane glutamic endopeptidase [Arenimonas soli]GGA79276.1 hypothetical protein GCM10011521_16900 [Arenimonas soli]
MPTHTIPSVSSPDAATGKTLAFPGSAAPATRRSPVATSVVVILAFLAVNAIGLVPFRAVAGDLTGWSRMAALATVGYGLYLVVPLLVAVWLVGRHQAIASLGLAGSPWQGLGVAAACSAIVLAWIAATSSPIPPDQLALALVRTALLPGLAEEILFRGFLFGVLWRYARWGFLPAALLSSVVFGLEHVYQGNDASEAFAIAVLTGIGGVWWSWLLVEWRWNLWVPISFHVLLNAYWTAFAVADDAFGSAMAVAVRLACIALSVLATLVYVRRHGGRQVTGSAWIRGRAPA